MNDDDLTNDLSRELRGRVDAMHGSSLGLGDVQVRARSIRRRRAATAVAGVVAAVGIIAPTAAMAAHHMGNDHPLPPATQSVDPTPTPTVTATDTGRQPAPGALDVSDLPTGYAPRMEYVTGGTTLHGVVGDAVDVGTRYPVVGFVTMYDGSTVWQTSDGQRSYVEVQESPRGPLLAPAKSAWGLATNVAHTAVAWVGPGSQVMVRSVGDPNPRPLGDPITAGTDLRVSVVGDGCGSGTSGCTVHVNVADAKGASSWQPWEVTASSSQRLLDGSFLGIADQSASGLTIGFTKLTDFGSCSKLAGGGEFQGWSTCRHTLVSFSPDGRLVLADPAYHDGIGNGVIGMYDAANGDLLFSRSSGPKAQSFYQGASWEDATHVLVTIFQANRWSIVRIGSDGSMQYAVPPVKGDMDHNPYVLATGGMPSDD